MKTSRSQILHGALLATSALVGSALLTSSAAMAGGPTGGTVAVGSATITNPSSTQTIINQSSKKAFIDWNSFSISSGSSVVFNQPNSKSLTVNRVTGPNASAIDGQLSANGNIWLLNANGVLFGRGSEVNVGALLATTSDLSDDDFRKGRYNFSKPSQNANASIDNQGVIHAANGGSVVLSGARVSNEGLIQADLGTVVLGGASTFTVDMTGDNLLRYQITAPVGAAPRDSKGNIAAALVSNSGTISASGGKILMTARAARNVEDNAINNTGMVEATSVSSRDGEIIFDAGPDGTVNAGGTVDASGRAPGQTGGSVSMTGGTVNVADGAKVDASGDQGGGSIQIGGGFHGQGTIANSNATNIGNASIKADAITSGNGGKVAVWSNGNTSFAGTISAKGGVNGGNGGFVETSGSHVQLATSAGVNTTAKKGATGNWLLDPTDISIVQGGEDGIGTTNAEASIDPNTIINALTTSNVTLEASDTISVLDAVLYNSANTLSLLAGGSINVQASVQNSGSGNLNLIAGWDGVTTSPASFATAGVYGNGTGNVSVGGANASGTVAIGSLGGATLVAGSSISLSAVNGSAQIGFNGGGATGNITVLSTGDMVLTGASECDCGAQIGNGGVFTTGDASGNLTVRSGGDLTLTSGSDVYSYAQIGNGGDSSSGNYSGDIAVTTGGAISLVGDGDYAQIGNAGWGVNGNGGGNITVNATGDISLVGGTGGVPFGYTQIGNGGQQFNGAANGNINVTTSGSLTLAAGDQGNYAQIGNGQVDAGSNSASGDVAVNVTGQTALFASEDEQVWIGNVGGAGESGNVTLITGTATGSIDATAMAIADLAGGNFTLGLTGDSDFAITGIADYNSTHALTILNAGSLEVTGEIQNSGTGDINLVAGWNPSVAPSAVQTTPGAYGNNGANILIGGANATGSAAIGSFGGTTTLLSDIVTIDAENGDTQLGYHGAGGGNIAVTATDEVFVDSDSQFLAQIGNGADDVAGNVTGNIAITTSGDVELFGDAEGAAAIIGNISQAAQSGMIAISAGSLDLDASGDDSFAVIGHAAVPGSPGGLAQGDISIALSGDLTLEADGSSSIAQIGSGAGNSNSAVSGAITINSASATLSSEGTSSLVRIGSTASGTVNSQIAINTTGDLILDADNQSANTIIGSATSGTLNGGIDVNSGGAVELIADGSSAQARIGDGGNTLSSDVSVTADGEVSLDAEDTGSIAHIGGLGAGNLSGDTTVTSSEGGVSIAAEGDQSLALIGLSVNGPTGGTLSGDVTIQSLGGDLDLDAGGAGSIAQLGNSAVQSSVTSVFGNITATASSIEIASEAEGAQAQIGNGGASMTGGLAGGTINVAASGSLDISSVSGESAAVINEATGGSLDGTAFIGNSANTPASESGSVTISAQELSGAELTVANDMPGGDVTLEITGSDNAFTLGNATFASIHNLNILSAGDVDITGMVQNTLSSGGGAINVVAGWDGTTVNPANFANAGVYGNNSGSIAIGGAGNAAVGDASGSLLVEGQDISFDATNGFAQIGYHGAGGGNITVNALGNADLTGNTESGFAEQIGNGSLANDIEGNVTGDIIVNVGGQTVLLGAGAGAGSWLGNVAGSGGTETGNVTLITGSGFVTADIITADLGTAAGTGGNVFIGFTQLDQTFIGDVSYNSANSFTFAATKDMLVDGDVQNSGNGALTLVAGWDGHTVGTVSQIQSANAFGLGGATLSVGADQSSGSVAVGSAGGTTTVLTGNLDLAATNGYAQIGYHGGGSGAVNVVALDNVTLSGGSGTGDYAQIGDGGYQVAGSSSAAVSVTAGGDVALDAGSGQEAYAQIGNGGAESNSQSEGYSETGLTTVSGQSVTLSGGTAAGSYAQIGNGGYKSGQSISGVATIGGDVVVSGLNAVTIDGGTGSDAYAQIGNGGDLVNSNAANGASGTISGDVSVTVVHGATAQTTTDPLQMIAGTGADSYVQIGNGGYSENAPAAGATVTFAISGDITVADLVLTGSDLGMNGYGQVGNGDAAKAGTGDVTGTVTVTGPSLTRTNGKAQDAPAVIGNATGHGTVSGTIDSADSINNPAISGTISNSVQNPVTPTSTDVTQVTVTPPVTSQQSDSSTTTTSSSSTTPQGPAPLEKLADAGSSGSEGDQTSDSVAGAVGKSLDGGKTIYVYTKTLIPGVLTQIVTLSPRNPHGVPPADEDYSSWGNEALWQW